jgi:hypothetical protein
MGEIASTARVAVIGPEYNAFLYAAIGADANGTVVSVLSAMARMNLDPWQETKDLAALSAKAATRRLASLIAAVPGGPSDPNEPALIAARLVKLLPSQTRSIVPPLPPRKELLDLKTLATSRMALYALLALIALVLAITWVRSYQPPTAAPHATHVSQAAQPTSGSAKQRFRFGTNGGSA